MSLGDGFRDTKGSADGDPAPATKIERRKRTSPRKNAHSGVRYDRRPTAASLDEPNAEALPPCQVLSLPQCPPTTDR
jgi:hypothetical protein